MTTTPGVHTTPANPRDANGNTTSVNTTRGEAQTTSKSMLADKGNTTRNQADTQVPPSHQPGTVTPNSTGVVKR